MPGGQFDWQLMRKWFSRPKRKERVANHDRIQRHSVAVEIGENPLAQYAMHESSQHFFDFTLSDIAQGD